LDIIAKLGQTQPPAEATAQPNNQQPKSVFQVNNNDNINTVMLSAEQVYLTNKIEASSMVIDTGSTYNLIGQHLLPVLNERLKAGGQLKNRGHAEIF